jgi:hypothetical protein
MTDECENKGVAKGEFDSYPRVLSFVMGSHSACILRQVASSSDQTASCGYYRRYLARTHKDPDCACLWLPRYPTASHKALQQRQIG